MTAAAYGVARDFAETAGPGGCHPPGPPVASVVGPGARGVQAAGRLRGERMAGAAGVGFGHRLRQDV
jgi:hypothetical protein